MAGLSANWTQIFGILGDIVSIVVYLSTLPTFYQIYKKKSTEGFQSIPYVVALFSSTLYMYYAFLIPDGTFLIIINLFGCSIETIYICIFLFYAPKKTRIQTMKLILLGNIGGTSLIILLVHFLTKGSRRTLILGWICLIFSLCVFIAPLCIVKQVIKTKSVKYMPFQLSFFLTLSAVMWFFYGLLNKNYYIAIPNILGFSFGVLQMVLYVMYKDAKKVTDQKLHELENQIEIIDLDEQKLPELKEQIVDVVKLTAMVCSDVIPVVPQLNVGGYHDTVALNLGNQMEITSK